MKELTDSNPTCRNCKMPLLLDAKFCAHCGQKDTDGRITFKELWVEFIDAVFNIESRTFLTLGALFVPGKLTKEYFQGKHKKFVHPLRVLIVSSILLIVALSFKGARSFTNHSYVIKDALLGQFERENVMDSLFQKKEKLKIHFDTLIAEQVLDTLYNDMRKSIGYYGDSINLSRYLRISDEERDMVAKEDFFNLSAKEIVQKYGIKGRFKKLLFRQKIKYVKNEAQLTSFLVGSITWIILLIMPFFALGLRLLYINKSYFYIEHLVFSFHFYSFSFIIYALLIFFGNILSFWLIIAFLLLLEIYFLMAIIKVYQQKFWLSFLKFLLLNLIYLSLFIGFLFGGFWIGFLIF